MGETSLGFICPDQSLVWELMRNQCWRTAAALSEEGVVARPTDVVNRNSRRKVHGRSRILGSRIPNSADLGLLRPHEESMFSRSSLDRTRASRLDYDITWEGIPLGENSWS